MGAAAAQEKIRDYEFTQKDFDRLRALVHKISGISLADHKQDLVYGRLARRLRATGAATFAEYYNLLESGDSHELEQFINAITTNLTAFFREHHHFDFLAKTVIPELEARNAATKKIRVWSAGCSTGEEPYSIAMTLLESVRRPEQWDIKVLATDLDSDVVAKAANGVYNDDRLKGMSEKRIERWFSRGTGSNEGRVKVKRELRELITFKQLNLMHPWPFRGPFDLMFCRNVVIYFNKDTQRLLFKRYAELLPKDTCLFIGHSESLYNVSDDFELVGNTIYRRR
ncbi:MAG: protein-glutamate O-methyltransferase CheR [Gammaproteobacteria bacterium]|nr:protein-glutamate O-methyltransferase CheR [Gammaproteobacteria bacterium]